MKAKLAVVVLVVLGFASCRDLGLPSGSPGSGSAGPEVGFIFPDVDGAKLSVNPDVELSAADVTGVAQVELRCGAPADAGGGQVQVRVWTAPPYRGTVDLTPCRPLGVAQPDGTLRLALVAHAQDRQGNPSNPDAVREVEIDLSVAVLTTTAPERAAPGAPLDFTVTADRDLQGVPQVLLGETVGLVTGGPRAFAVHFDRTPGLGVDVYDGGTAAPLEVLQDVERPVVLSIQARTLSGNVSQLNVSVTLSRLRWQRQIPNVVFTGTDLGGWPVATASGLQIPLSVGPGRWVPGFFARDDGAFTPFPQSALDGGFVFRGFDGQGDALVNRLAGRNGPVEVMFFPPGGASPLAPPAVSPLATSSDDPSGIFLPMARLSNALCEASATTACGSSVQAVACVSPSGFTRATFTSPLMDTAAPQNGFGSGGTYLGINLPALFCTSPVHLEWETAVGSTLRLGPNAQPPCGAGCPPRRALERVLPFGDGAFFVSQDAGTGLQAFAVEANAVSSSVYFSGTGAHDFSADQLMVARRDRAVVTFRGASDHSEFALYAPQPAGAPGAGLLGQSTIPVYLLAPNPGAQAGLDAVALPDHKVAMVFNLGQSFNYGLVVFDASLRPRWLYRYPQLALSAPILVGAGDTVYFIDTTGQTVLAFTP